MKINFKKNEKIVALLEKGFFRIFSSSFINKIIQFGTIILLARVIDKSEYGIYSLAKNDLNLLLLLEGLGSVLGVLQYCSMKENVEEKLAFLKLGIKMGLIANVVLSIILLVYSNFSNNIVGVNNTLLKMSFIPILSVIYNTILSYLRATLRNKEFSNVSIINSIMYFFGNIILGYIWGINGIIIGTYLCYLVTIFVSFNYIRCDLNLKISVLDKYEKNEFIKYSIVTALTTAMSQMLYLLDTSLVGGIMQNQYDVADYKVATLIPFNLTFITMSIMIFCYPYFAQKFSDKNWIRSKVKVLEKYLIIINLVIAIVCFLLAPFIIKILWGNDYMGAVPSFRILMIGFFISSTFRIPYGNILASLKCVRENFYNSILSGICNILLDIYLISRYGIIGAALATLIVFIVSSIFSKICLLKYLREDD
ncbi:polysaccharide biosynthesis C-terminal domain-containing protein [Clostridium perfringens]|uniref:oligosaccharide flippase family protein n=1 Tax=Clostridium perfringens TaxID=1502 RepID=UPI0039ECE5A2